MTELDQKILNAANNDTLFESLMIENKLYLLHIASRYTHKYITESDDEWSIVLIAFHHAVITFHPDKGDFFAYATTLIRHALVDYYRSTKKYNSEWTVSPKVFEIQQDPEQSEISISRSLSDQVTYLPDQTLNYEIETANAEFLAYGFSFYDLISVSPKSKKTKLYCQKAVFCILHHPESFDELIRTKRLPVKFIQNYTGIPQKILDRHRKYIIAAIVILSGDYPILSEYIPFSKAKEV